MGSDNIDVVDVDPYNLKRIKWDIQNLFSMRSVTSDTVENGSGVRYGIISNDAEGEVVNLGDIVMIDYVAYTLEGNVLGTTFQSVADTSEIISSPRQAACGNSYR